MVCAFALPGALQYLVPILTSTLTKQEEFEDEDEWKPNRAAGVCILLAATCCEDSILEHVMPFVTGNIQSQDWRYREASIMAFANILEGPSQATLMPYAVQAMPVLIQSMQDSMTPVRDTVAYAIGRVCDFLPEAIVGQAYTGVLVEVILVKSLFSFASCIAVVGVCQNVFATQVFLILELSFLFFFVILNREFLLAWMQSLPLPLITAGHYNPSWRLHTRRPTLRLGRPSQRPSAFQMCSRC